MELAIFEEFHVTVTAKNTLGVTVGQDLGRLASPSCYKRASVNVYKSKSSLTNANGVVASDFFLSNHCSEKYYSRKTNHTILIPKWFL